MVCEAAGSFSVSAGYKRLLRNGKAGRGGETRQWPADTPSCAAVVHTAATHTLTTAKE